jgi:RNA polymerase sigma factor (sigma-70 family)
MADQRKERSREPINPTSDDLDQSHWPDIERRVVVFRLVDDLPADQRSVIIKRFVEEKSIRDIAEEFGRSGGAIKQLQFRALETLRARVASSHE